MLCVHPQLVPQLEVPQPKPCLPLGLAHMLATSAVRVYEDGAFQVLRDLVRCAAVRGRAAACRHSCACISPVGACGPAAFQGGQRPRTCQTRLPPPPPRRLQRPLAGAEWSARRLGPVFPAGLLVVLDRGLLPRLDAADLQRVLAEVERLAGGAAAADHPGCAWFVVAPREDVAALQAAAAGGQQPAAAAWQLWHDSSRARALEPDETGTQLHGAAPAGAGAGAGAWAWSALWTDWSARSCCLGRGWRRCGQPADTHAPAPP